MTATSPPPATAASRPASARSEPARPDSDTLAGQLTALRQRLECVLAGEAPPPIAATAPPLVRIGETFGLTPFERVLLLVAAAPGLDESCARALGELGGATFALTSRLADAPHWSALAPTAPLRYWRLIEWPARHDGALATAPLATPERVTLALLGVATLDEGLHGFVSAATPGPLPPLHHAVAERLAAQLAAETGRVILLDGADDAARRDVLAQAAALAGLRAFVLRTDDVPADPAERDRLARRWMRDALLAPAALVLDGEWTAAARALAERVRTPLLCTAPDARLAERRDVLQAELTPASGAERRTWWAVALGDGHALADAELDTLAGHFTLGPAQIASAVASAEAREAAPLWAAARQAARPRLDGLAERLVPRARWEALVLPAAQLALLRQIVAHVRHRVLVQERWGFAETGRGTGTGVLFTGASGTGKTLAAEVLAGALALELYRVDLSQVVSKYIGETEKNLARVFAAAETGGAVLLFDEADALFGKRTDVKDSHDRYANQEVSYLLQRMEAYRGLAILTSNQRQALDAAFLRRLRFVVEFPFPDAAARAELWRRAIPAAAPAEGLDVAMLARLAVPGGAIRSIALNAAFVAAEAGEPLRMTHLADAARAEAAKHGAAAPEAELRGWR